MITRGGKRPGAGRPKRSEPRVQVPVKVTCAELDDLRELARREGLSLVDTYRLCVKFRRAHHEL